MNQHNMLPYIILFSGVLVVSSSSILVRLAQMEGMPSLTIAAGRMLLASLLLTPVAWRYARHELLHLPRRTFWPGVLAGLFLALHFATWISSLDYTSVASSVALVSTDPLWVGLVSVLFLHERLRWGIIGGIVLTIAGSALIAFSDSSAGAGTYAAPLFGDMLALIGSITASGYVVIGSTLRKDLSLLAYIWLVYTSSAVVLVLIQLLAGQSLTGYTSLAYLYVLLLAVGPQLLGHSSFNWALRYLSPTFVAISILGEPIGASLLAWLLFGETFAPLQLPGFVLLLVGIYVATIDSVRQQ